MSSDTANAVALGLEQLQPPFSEFRLARLLPENRSFPCPARAGFEVWLNGKNRCDLQMAYPAKQTALSLDLPEQYVDEVWIELDSPTLQDAPAIFVGLRNNNLAAIDWLHQNLGWPSLDSLSQRLGSHLQQLRHLGFFPSRAGAPLRCNLRQIDLTKVTETLAEVGWIGPTAEILQSLQQQIPQATVCFDVLTDSGQITPGFGLECRSQDWPSFFQWLETQQLCRPEESQASLAWPGYSTPPQTELPWPYAWIRRSLDSQPKLPVLQRSINHVKLNILGNNVQAKAYLMWNLNWMN